MQLQPLRIPAGWRVVQNKFFSVAATRDQVEAELSPFTQDLLQLRHEQSDCLIDLGWTPEGDFDNGALHLQVYRTDFRGQRLWETRTQEIDLIVTEIERLCHEISSGKIPPT